MGRQCNSQCLHLVSWDCAERLGMVTFYTDLSSSSRVMSMGLFLRSLGALWLLNCPLLALLTCMCMHESSNSFDSRSTYALVCMIEDSSVTMRLFRIPSYFPLSFRIELSLTDSTSLWALCLVLWRMVCFLSFWRVSWRLSSSIWYSLMVLLSNLFSSLSCLLAEKSLSASFLKQSSQLLSTHISSFSFFKAIFLFSSAASSRTSRWASLSSSRTISNTSSSCRDSFFSMWACTSSMKELIFRYVAAVYYWLRWRAGLTISWKKLMNLLPMEFLRSAPKAEEDQDLPSSLSVLLSRFKKSIIRLNCSQSSYPTIFTIQYQPTFADVLGLCKQTLYSVAFYCFPI